MKHIISSTLLLVLVALSGCGDKAAREAENVANPTFMFFNFRKEIVSDDYHVPEMKSEAAGRYLQNRVKTVPGYVKSSFDLNSQTMSIAYKSTTVRKMNFEEAIALSGFAVNNRPANPAAKIPEGVK